MRRRWGGVQIVTVTTALLLVLAGTRTLAAPSPQPPHPVEVTNESVAVDAAQSGQWSVSATQAGTWNVGITGSPTARPGLPEIPFLEQWSLRAWDERVVGGPWGTIGLTSMTITNENKFGDSFALIEIGLVATSEPNCAGAVVGGGVPLWKFDLRPRETLHLPFPTPVVLEGMPVPGKASGPEACIRLVRTDTGEASVRVTLNGFAVS